MKNAGSTIANSRDAKTNDIFCKRLFVIFIAFI